LAIYQRGDAIFVKIVAWLARNAEAERRVGTLYVRTDPNALIIALNEKSERLWIYNGDQIPRWIAEHRKQLQRWAQDAKAEHLPVPPFSARRGQATLKFQNRMDSACHQVAALIAGYASRQRVAGVRYTDADKSFCEAFPWSKLRQVLAEKLDAAAIAFETSDQDGSEKAAPSSP